MRIIFLDVDGVLNTPDTESTTRSGHRFIDEDKVKLVCKLTQITGSIVVVSSGWCFGGMLSAAGVTEGAYVADYNELMSKLSEYKVALGGRISISSALPKDKGAGIREWLKQNDNRVEQFIVIDDNVDKLGLEEYSDKLIKTDSNVGITLDIVINAAKKLLRDSLISSSHNEVDVQEILDAIEDNSIADKLKETAIIENNEERIDRIADIVIKEVLLENINSKDRNNLTKFLVQVL